MTIIATKRLFTTADGKTLVDPGDESAAILFCVPGQRIEPKRLARVENAAKYFEKEAEDAADEAIRQNEELTQQIAASVPHKRVEPEAKEASAKAPKIKK